MIIDAVCYPWHLKGVLPKKGEPGYKVWSYLHTMVEGEMFRSERGDIAIANKTLTVEDMVESLDKGGIDKAVLHMQSHTTRDDKWRMDPKLVPKLVDQYPKRFIMGGYDVDPHEGMKGVRELADAVNSYGYKAWYVSPTFSMYPHLPPNHPMYYPFYTRCIDLDIAFFVLTRTSISPIHGQVAVSHPYHLDDVATILPELRIIGRAFPWPWTEDMLAVVWRNDNVWMTTSHFTPAHWPQSFIDFMSSPKGKTRTAFSSGGPMADYAGLLNQIKQRFGSFPKGFEENYFSKNIIEALKIRI